MENFKSIKTKLKLDNDEFCVELFIDGKHIENADYFTNDLLDATQTAKDMARRAERNVKRV